MSTAPVFIVGAPRSGTTLLRRMLNAHPALHLTFEASYFSLIRSMRRRISAEAFREAWTGSLPFAWQRVSPEALSVAAPPGLPPRDPRWFTALMTYSAKRYGKARFGDKTPLHMYELGALFEAFPDARVIHIVRDPVAVVRSHLAVPWAGLNVLGTAISVRSALDAVKPFRDRIHEVRLEDLLSAPEAELRGVLEFCALEWSDHVLDPEQHAPHDEPPVPWLATRSSDRASLPARPTLSPADAWRVSRITAPQRRRYGYAPLAPVKRSVRGHVVRALTDIRELSSVCVALWRLRRVLRRWPRPDAMEVFDAVTALRPGAALACSPAQRSRFRSWLRTAHPMG